MGQPSSNPLRAPTSGLRPFPRAALLLVGSSFLVAVVIPAHSGATFGLLSLALKLAAALGACVLATWAEERLHAAQLGYVMARRIAVGAGVLALALLGTPVLLLVFGVSGVLVGDEGTLAVAALAGGLWLGSAALGSLVVLVLDVAVSALLPDLRTRFQVAVLGLLAVTVAVAALVFRTGAAVASWIENVEPTTLPLEGLGDARWLALLAEPGASERATRLFFLCAAAIALPAVLSACAKLAEMVMVRLHPLRVAFRSLARGDYDTRVEEGGGQELRELGRSFNQMAESLVQAREEVQRLNEELEGQVATRTRELRTALDELQAAQTRLVETEKHAMLSRLTAGLLHEVNSPLGALRSASDTIRRSTDQIAKALEESSSAAPPLPSTAGPSPAATLLRSARASASLATVMVESTRRIEELMESLRRFVSLDGAERQLVDVRGSVDAALALVPALGTQFPVSRAWPATPLLVLCFPARMNQVFLNVLQNAAAALADAAGGELAIEAAERDSELVVTIADTGRGMTAEQLAVLFDFGFTRKEGGRIGLRFGLPSSKRWVEEVGGSIAVASAPGAGTTVTIRLPRGGTGAHRTQPT